MKRALIIALSVLMLVSVLCVGAFADGSAALTGDKRVECKAGDTVTVKVYISNNPGTQVVRFLLDLDEHLTLKEITSDSFDGVTYVDCEYVLLDRDSNFSGGGAICNLVLEVAPGTPAGEYMVNFSDIDAVNDSFVDYKFENGYGSVLIVDEGGAVKPDNPPATKPDSKTSPKTGDSLLTTLFTVTVLSGAAYVTVSKKKFSEN